MKDNSMQRAIAYSMLAQIFNSKDLINGFLDVFVPLVKNVLHAMTTDGQSAKGESTIEICNKIKEQYDIDIPTPVMVNVLHIIEKELNANGANNMAIYEDGSFIIKEYAFEDYHEQLKNSQNDVMQINYFFSKFCELNNINGSDNKYAIFHFIEHNRIDISLYLANKNCNVKSNETIAARFVETFKNEPTVYNKVRDMYLGSIITSYLEYRPINIKKEVELLFDTNFIVSLLDLNTPESTKVCNTLIDVCKKMGYSFTVMKDTIDETQILLHYKADNIDNVIIEKVINREDIYNACDRRKLTKADLYRISANLEEILTRDYNCTIKYQIDTLRNKAKHSLECEKLRPYRHTENAAIHDAMAILYVREKRNGRRVKEFEKCNCWFVNNAITHNSDHDLSNIEVFRKIGAQEETIKANDLLNILWLSNPNLSLSANEIIDLGITSLISDTINASLPKARIIKELDDNIQKYKDDYSITDTDVYNLSMRIAKNQVDDINKINEIAKSDPREFADRVKKISEKEENEKIMQAKAFEKLINQLNTGIKAIVENKNKLENSYNMRMESLSSKEIKYKDNIERLTSQLSDKENIIRNLYGKECEKNKLKREEYRAKALKKKKKNVLIIFVVVTVCFIGSVLLSWFLNKNSIKEGDQTIVSFITSKYWEFIISFILLVIDAFFMKSCYSYWLDKVYIADFKEKMELPKDLQDITFDEFKKLNI